MKNNFRDTLGLFQPVQLLLAGLAYSLGINIARYLGITIDRILLFGGGLFVLCTIAAASALDAYFGPQFLFPKNIEDNQERNFVLRFLFFSSIGLLGVCSVFIFYLILRRQIQMEIYFLFAVFAFIGLCISIPPIRLSDRGFGEISRAVLISSFPVLIAFMLQEGNIHRLVTYLSFPILLLSLSYLLGLEFSDYATDLKYNHQSLLMRLTWQRAIPVHNIMVISAYIFFIAAPLVGIPLGLSWAPLLTLPLAIYQIIILRNIELGLKPDWRILKVNALAMAGLATYLLSFTFWIR